MTVDVLIVERTAGVRDALAALLDGTDGIRVTGVSADADAALRMVKDLAPDVVLLGADLPGAAEVVRRIMSEHPLPTVALIDPDQPELGAPLLAEGAVSLQLRPRDATAARRFRSVVAAMSQVSVVRRRIRPCVTRPRPAIAVTTGRTPARMIAVAASTGGPVALQQLFSNLPEDLAAPVVVVQHIVAGFSAGLVASLQVASPLPVTLATDGEVLEAGVVYLAPDDRHLTVTRGGRARLDDSPPVSGFRPSASVLFSSLASAYGEAAVAVVLTGMGTDGLSGLHDVHAAGGCILAQDEASSVVFGMPGAPVAAGIADLSAPIEDLAHHIGEFTLTTETR
jgi:two-component system chemotaxis response regulator CheB